MDTQVDTREQLRQAVQAAIQSYENGYEAERSYYAEHLPMLKLPDYRKRNERIDPSKAQLLFSPEATHKQVSIHYDDVFANIPWRTIRPIVAIKETPKLFMVGYDSDLDSLNRHSQFTIADPGDPIDTGSLHIDSSLQFAFEQIPKSELGNRIFRTAQEAFDALPTEHKLPRAEMERRYAEAKLSRNADLFAEDEARRSLPCARCRQPIGPERAYDRHLGGLTSDKSLRYVHLDCRKCELCGETITGEYVYLYIEQSETIREEGHIHISTLQTTYQDKHYYHAACAYQAGVKPTNSGARNEEYGFYTHDASFHITA